MVLVSDPLADTGSIRPAVCLSGSVPLQAQLPGCHVGLLLAVQCSTHLIFLLPQHAVQCLKGGGDCHTIHLRAVHDSWVSVFRL